MEQKWQILQDPRSYLLDPLSELKVHGFDALLQSLLVDLKVVGAFFLWSLLSPVLGAGGPGRGLGGMAEAPQVWRLPQISGRNVEGSCSGAGGAQGVGPQRALGLTHLVVLVLVLRVGP